MSQDTGYLPDIFSTAAEKAGPTVVHVDQCSVVPGGWGTAGRPQNGSATGMGHCTQAHQLCLQHGSSGKKLH